MMSELKKPLAIAVGVALASAFAFASTASADSSPFLAAALSSGYLAAAALGRGSHLRGQWARDAPFPLSGPPGKLAYRISCADVSWRCRGGRPAWSGLIGLRVVIEAGPTPSVRAAGVQETYS